MKKILLTVLVLVSLFGCGEPKYETGKLDKVIKGNVTIFRESGYFKIEADLSNNDNHYEFGKNLGEASIEMIPDYEKIFDTYLLNFSNMMRMDQSVFFSEFTKRAETISINLKKEYIDEIKGLASALSGKEDRLGDEKLSYNEILIINLLGDIGRTTMCSALSVYGDKTENGNVITGRNLDWFDPKNDLSHLHSVLVIKNNKKSICMIGYLGHLGTISGFNDDGIFAAVLDSLTKTKFTYEEKRSYFFDLRESLENTTSILEIGNFMTKPNHLYTINHLIFLSNKQKSYVLENDFDGNGNNIRRELRQSDSKLSSDVEWGIEDSIGAVNCFMLEGNHDNYTSVNNKWKSVLGVSKYNKYDIKQLWKLEENTDGTKKIKAKANNCVLDLPDLSLENNMLIMLRKNTIGENQKWFFEKIKKNEYVIISKNSGKVLELNKKEKIVQNQRNESDEQKWILEEINGSYTIKSKKNKKALSLVLESTSNTERWKNMVSNLKKKGKKVTKEELKEVITFDNGNGPDTEREGDLYNKGTSQTIIFEPETLELEVAFRPIGEKMPTDPIFTKIKVNFN